jgi:hypothetical protein
MQTDLVYILSGCLGVFLQICLKVKSLKQSSAAANMQFVFSKYLQDDWPSIAASFITVGCFIVFIPDIIQMKPDALKFGRIGFAFVGYTGSSIIQALFSVTSKKILQLTDIKTNIADGVVPPVTKENEAALPEAMKGDTLEK